MTLKVTSSAFESGQGIPERFTCEGANSSPPLQWTGVPADARSLALICDDPDAPVGTLGALGPLRPTRFNGRNEREVPTSETLPSGAKQGVNDFKRVGYGGPCPPPGKPHRYYFKLYALDTNLGLKPRATKAELLRAMKSHLLAESELIGTYRRRR
jgi:Raf kinase inhibitor-like YbhB/YbcL family protein